MRVISDKLVFYKIDGDAEIAWRREGTWADGHSVPMCSLSGLWLSVTLWTVVFQAPQSMRFSRRAAWSGLPCPSPGDLPEKIFPSSCGSCTGGGILYYWEASDGHRSRVKSAGDGKPRALPQAGPGSQLLGHAHPKPSQFPALGQPLFSPGKAATRFWALLNGQEPLDQMIWTWWRWRDAEHSRMAPQLQTILPARSRPPGSTAVQAGLDWVLAGIQHGGSGGWSRGWPHLLARPTVLASCWSHLSGELEADSSCCWLSPLGSHIWGPTPFWSTVTCSPREARMLPSLWCLLQRVQEPHPPGLGGRTS